jgi:TRAP-type C4-dicarboxylate transport system substrate-binding protein
LSGYSAKWYEVSTHLVRAADQLEPQIHAVNQKAWAKIDPKVQEFLQTNIKAMVSNMWDAAAAQTQEGYDCNTGAAACTQAGQGQDGAGAALGRRPRAAQDDP